MRPLLNLGRRRARTLSQVLSQHLSKTKEGQKIIRAFGKDRTAGSAALIEYIDKVAKDQPEFKRQVMEALGEEAGQRFSTIIASGGHVDQIINAGVVEKLTIRSYLFQDVWQIITFLLGVALIGGIIFSGYWWARQPRIMTGDFNIAVAEFSQLGEATPKVAPIVSQEVFRFLDDQAKLIAFEDVQVSHKNIGVITSAEEAKTLAKQIHAQVVIYGDVTAIGTQIRLTPQFYISEAFRADASELNGQQKLAAPVSFRIDELLAPTSEPIAIIRERTVIMTEFTKALVFLTAGKLPLAKEAIEQSIKHSEQQPPFEGQEVLYLFGSHITRLEGDRATAQKYINEALALNPNYGRAYIAQANIYFDQGDLYQAIKYYEKAKGLANQPFGAYILEKASLGIGHSCWVQLQYVKQNLEPDPLGTADLAQCVLENYQRVIDSYLQQDHPDPNLKEMAAWAYYGIGTIDEQRGHFQEARKMYERALKITGDQDLIQRTEIGLKDIK